MSRTRNAITVFCSAPNPNLVDAVLVAVIRMIRPSWPTHVVKLIFYSACLFVFGFVLKKTLADVVGEFTTNTTNLFAHGTAHL